MMSKIKNINIMFIRVILYYYLFLFSLLCILAIVCSSYFAVSNTRFPMNEIEDSETFNRMFPDIANGMLYDMSYSQRNYSIQLPPDFIKHFNNRDTFLDIGSGGGDASIFHLQNFFGKNVKIVLSDLHPKINLWEKLTSPTISYIKEPLDATNLSNIQTNNAKIMSCFGSLHHMNEDTIGKILSQVREKNMIFFIVEPRRFPNVLQYLHILTLPIFGFLSYTIISLFGSAIVSDNIINGITRFLLVPFFMTWDHILGASRRYSLKEIEELANQKNMKTIHHSDMIFDYYIIHHCTFIPNEELQVKK